jgi:ABC-type antimicrobial peptide transport system permease subunit
MMRAVGFARAELTMMVFYEHTSLMLCGLIFGVVAGTVSVWPVISAGAADVPYAFLCCMVAAIAVSGFLWIWLASVFALRGNILQALRQE